MLDQKSIYVWRIRLDSAAAYHAEQVALWRKLLSPEELSKADRFHAEGHRRDYIVAHAALRVVLGDCLDLPAGEVRFAAASSIGTGASETKPSLLGETDGRSQLRFNLSHSGGTALIGVAMDREIGVDIERQRHLEDMNAMARSIFSCEEMAQWTKLPEADRNTAFYRVWTRKEAYLKAIGLGLYRNLQDVTVPLAIELTGDSAQPCLVRDQANTQETWSVRDVPVMTGYSAALCCRGERPGPLLVDDLDINQIV